MRSRPSPAFSISRNRIASPKPAAADKPAVTVEAIEADGYRKFGPGPIASIRLKWTVRREASGEYYVDETVGENSTPIVSGPMAKDAAVRMVDDREREAQRQFAQLKGEMASGAVAANPIPKERQRNVAALRQHVLWRPDLEPRPSGR